MVKRFAIIDSNGVVKNITKAETALELNWVESNDAHIGWTYDGTTFSPPPPPPIDEVMAQKLDEINGAFEQAMDTLVAGYPEREISSWPQQEKEARAYLADNTASTPLLDSLSAARGIDKSLIVQKITQKADQYAQAAGALIGKRQVLEDSINSAATLEELEAIQWS